MNTRFKTHAVNFMDWALSDYCPYAWYNGLWYNSLKQGKGVTTAELYDIWIQTK